MNDPFPLGKPLNRPKPAEHKPEREDIKKGIFSVDGKLQTELIQKGPRFAPKPAESEPEPVPDSGVGFFLWYLYGKGRP